MPTESFAFVSLFCFQVFALSFSVGFSWLAASFRVSFFLLHFSLANIGLMRRAIGTGYSNRQSRVVHRRSLDFHTHTSLVSEIEMAINHLFESSDTIYRLLSDCSSEFPAESQFFLPNFERYGIVEGVRAVFVFPRTRFSGWEMSKDSQL